MFDQPTKKRIFNLSEQKELRRKLRRKSTHEEVILWTLLKGRQVNGYKFRRQFSVGPYVMDFYCPEAKLCVELDGRHHHDDRVKPHDSRRDSFLTAEGIEVLRIDNCVVRNSPDLAVMAIAERLMLRFGGEQ